MDRDDGIEAELQEFVDRQRRANTPGERGRHDSQRATGNGNVLVGVANAPVTIGRNDDFDPDNPNMQPCPSCWKPVSKLASPCPRCGYDVAKHHHNAELKRRQERYERWRARIQAVMLCALVIAMGGMWLGAQPWMPDNLSKPLFWLAVGAIIFMGVLARILS